MHEEDHEHTHYHGVDRAEEHVGVDAVLNLLIGRLKTSKVETVRALDASGRVLAKDVHSNSDIPKRSRSTRDGYAINFDSLADEGQEFDLIGEVRIGTIPKISLKPGQAARVATGSFLPEGTTGVLMVEYVEEARDHKLVAKKKLVSRENILERGEDIPRGSVLLSKGSRVFPHHVALFSMLGIPRVLVYARPKIAIFSTGDELVDATATTKASSLSVNSIFDANRPFLHGMIKNLGALPVDLGIAKDKFGIIKRKMVRGLRYDGLILSAGSSVGERDYVSKAVESIPGVDVLAHGISMRPSSPTGIAVYRKKPVLLLPGFPTSAIISFFVFGVPAILKISGSLVPSLPSIKANMTEEYAGKSGIRHYVRVKVSRVNSEYQASIVKPSEAQYSSWIQSANGIAVINDGTAKQGDSVDVLVIGEIPSRERSVF